jgi:hypothetical protein
VIPHSHGEKILAVATRDGTTRTITESQTADSENNTVQDEQPASGQPDIIKQQADRLGLTEAEGSWMAALNGTPEARAESSDDGCADCDYKGYRINADGLAVNCHCFKDRLYFLKFAEAGIPPEYFGNTLSSHWNLTQDAYGEDLGVLAMQKQKAFNLMSRYIKVLPAICAGLPLRLRHRSGDVTKVKSLLVEGGEKSGKTLLAAVAAQSAIRNGLDVQFFDWTQLVGILMDYRSDEKLRETRVRFGEADLIVIDGVFNYHIPVPSFEFELDLISRARLNSGRPTLITMSAEFKKGGPGWKSLIDSAFPLRLPSPLSPKQRY